MGGGELVHFPGRRDAAAWLSLRGAASEGGARASSRAALLQAIVATAVKGGVGCQPSPLPSPSSKRGGEDKARADSRKEMAWKLLEGALMHYPLEGPGVGPPPGSAVEPQHNYANNQPEPC